MKTLFQRDGLLTIVVVGALSAGFLWGFYLPERNAAESLKKEIVQIKGTIRQIPVRVAELESLKTDVQTREEFLKKSESWMPGESRISAVLEHVTQLAKNAQLTVTRLEPKPAEPADSYRTMPFRITFQGGFTGIASFMKGLEEHERTITFEEVSLKQNENEGISATQADLHFSVFAEGRDFAESGGNNTSGKDSAADTRIR